MSTTSLGGAKTRFPVCVQEKAPMSTTADLANDLGSRAQRSLSMIGKQYGGLLPEPGAFSDNDKAILAMADGMLEQARPALLEIQVRPGQACVGFDSPSQRFLFWPPYSCPPFRQPTK